MTLGARLRALRQQAGLSQRELADGLVNKSMISQIESDRVQPSVELLVQLVDRLGADLESLLPAKLDDQERLARYKRAQAFFTLHHYAQALPMLQDCLPVQHPAWNPYELHFQIAVCHHRMEQPDAALHHYEAALEIAIRENRVNDEFVLYRRLGEVAITCERWALAVHWLEHAEQGAVPDSERLALCIWLARAHHAQGQEEAAERYWLEGAGWISAFPRRRVRTHDQAEIAAGLGGLYLKQGKFPQAEEHLQAAQALYERCRDREAALRVRMQRGVLLCRCGEQQEALRWLEECRVQALASGFWSLLAEVLRELAGIRRGEGQLREAIRLLEDSLQTLAGNMGEFSTRFIGTLRYELADALAAADLWTRAREQAERAVELFRQTDLERELVAAYRLLSTIFIQLGNYQQASECLTRSQELFTQLLLGLSTKSLRMIP